MIKAIIFDFDGTIVDTESPWYDLVSDLYRGHGHVLPLAEYLTCIGTSGGEFNVYRHLENLLGKPIDRKGIKQDLSNQHSELMKTTDMRPGVLDMIVAAHSRGIPLAIGSSSPAVWVHSYLNRFDLAHYFKAVITADDVSKVKPDPELFNKARAALGSAANETLVFEDSCYGLDAAKAAGLPCVAVHNRLTVAMNFTGAARVYANFTEFSLDEVINL